MTLRLPWTTDDYLAQLRAAWPEWEIGINNDEPDTPVYVASLRINEGQTQLLARHLAALEGLLFNWEKRQQQA